jgi:hypothetical protein
MIDKKDLKKIYIWKIKMSEQGTCSRYPATMKLKETIFSKKKE